MDTDSFIIDIKTENFYEDTADEVEKKLIHQIMSATPLNAIDHSLPTGKNKKVIGLMKDKLRTKIMTEFAALRPKTYSYLMDDDSEAKKVKGTKKCVIKRMLTFLNYKDRLLNNETILKS